MSSPVATPSDLATYLGLATIDPARALLLLSLAQGLCEAVVNPLPPGSAAVVLDVAKRGFVNPDGAQEVAIGSARVQYANQTSAAPSGLYLSKANKANLQLLAGKGGAFNIDTLPQGVDAVQVISFSGTVTGGTWTLSVGQTTAPIAWNADAPTVQAALSVLSSIGAGNVVISGSIGGPFVATFVNELGSAPIQTMVANGASLTGTSPAVNVVSTVTGEFAPGQNLPPWDSTYGRGRFTNGLC